MPLWFVIELYKTSYAIRPCFPGSGTMSIPEGWERAEIERWASDLVDGLDENGCQLPSLIKHGDNRWVLNQKQGWYPKMDGENNEKPY